MPLKSQKKKKTWCVDTLCFRVTLAQPMPWNQRVMLCAFFIIFFCQVKLFLQHVSKQRANLNKGFFFPSPRTIYTTWHRKETDTHSKWLASLYQSSLVTKVNIDGYDRCFFFCFTISSYPCLIRMLKK